MMVFCPITIQLSFHIVQYQVLRTARCLSETVPWLTQSHQLVVIDEMRQHIPCSNQAAASVGTQPLYAAVF